MFLDLGRLLHCEAFAVYCLINHLVHHERGQHVGSQFLVPIGFLSMSGNKMLFSQYARVLCLIHGLWLELEGQLLWLPFAFKKIISLMSFFNCSNHSQQPGVCIFVCWYFIYSYSWFLLFREISISTSTEARRGDYALFKK